MSDTTEQLVDRIETALRRLERVRARDTARLRDLEAVAAAGVAELDALLEAAR